MSGPILVGLALASYGTSFFRERYLIQEALGSASLDNAVVVYAIGATVGNLYAVSLGIVWIDGRRIRRRWAAFSAYAALGAALSLAFPAIGTCLVITSVIAAFEYRRQLAAFRGRQQTVLVAAVIAPFVSLAWWMGFGLESMVDVVAGYSAGFALQAVVAWRSSRGAIPKPEQRSALRSQVSAVWPVLFASLTQINGNLDRILLGFAGKGWAAAGGFALNLATAAMLIVVGPLASEAVAGRVRDQVSRTTLIVITGATIVALVLTPLVLPILVSGGRVQGSSYDRVRNLTIIYLSCVPAAGYWLFRARAVQKQSDAWRPVALITALMLVLHLAISVPALLADRPLLIAIGWAVSSYVGAALMATKRASRAFAPQAGVTPQASHE